MVKDVLNDPAHMAGPQTRILKELQQKQSSH